MNPVFFKSQEEFRQWLAAHHASQTEVWVGFYRKDSGLAGITYAEALDEALCFGWIDGVRKKVDAQGYTNRFTPRKAKSVWSNVNTAKVQVLIKAGKMAAAGLTAFEARDGAKAGAYSFENKDAELTGDLLKQFQANRKAWAFYQTLPRYYRHTTTWWVVSAKQEETRLKRLKKLMEFSAKGLRFGNVGGKKK